MIVRHCITKYTDEVGNLWVSLADYFIIRGVFDKGRDVFEEALEKVVTARDFGIIYNAYLKFEEELLMVVMEEGDVELTDKKENITDDADLMERINSVLKITDDAPREVEIATVGQEELLVKRIES